MLNGFAREQSACSLLKDAAHEREKCAYGCGPRFQQAAGALQGSMSIGKALKSVFEFRLDVLWIVEVSKALLSNFFWRLVRCVADG